MFYIDGAFLFLFNFTTYLIVCEYIKFIRFYRWCNFIFPFIVTWKLNRQALRTLVLMNSPKVGTPWLFLFWYMENERESPTWNSACYWNGNDSQNDNDTSLRSWRSTRQRWDSYDTVCMACILWCTLYALIYAFHFLTESWMPPNRDKYWGCGGF